MTVEEIRNYKQIRTPDYARLASLVSQAKGPDRTMAQFAEITGIGASTLSRLVNLNIKKPLSIDTLIKIYEARANAEDEFLLDALARANGMYDPEYADRVQNHEAGPWNGNERINREHLMKNAIIGSLVAGGHNVSVYNTPMMDTSNLSPMFPRRLGDFALRMEGDEHPNANKLWSFNLDAHILADYDGRYPMDGKRFVRDFFARRSGLFLVDAWKPEELRGTKLSFVFLDKDIFGAFWNALTVAKVHNEISLILIDPTTYRVLDEIWVPGDYNPTVGVRYFDDTPDVSDTDDEYEDTDDFYEEDPE